MATLLALYAQPTDPAAFDAYYFSTHVPIAKRVPGLLSYHVGRNPGTIAGTPCYLVAALEFASPEAIQAALASPEGQAAAADLGNFASGGVTLLSFDEQPV